MKDIVDAIHLLETALTLAKRAKDNNDVEQLASVAWRLADAGGLVAQMLKAAGFGGVGITEPTGRGFMLPDAANDTELQDWRKLVGAQMPSDFKDYHDNIPAERPLVTALTLASLRDREKLAYEAMASAVTAAAVSVPVDRFEVVEHTSLGVGRAFSRRDVNVQFSWQDDSHTLKVFVS